MQEYIDLSYYENLVDEAKAAVAKYNHGDFDSFMSDDPLAPYMNIPEDSDEEVPFTA